ncbi:MAG TPA: T9SS type A sorting domain-containing protein [Cytophagales bacterium]|nr:T9SS type A sorting domain-containing protein [Cytophagales bacterium]
MEANFINLEKNYTGKWLVMFGALVFSTICFFNSNSAEAQCTASANTQNWTTLNWSSCTNPPKTDGGSYSGSYIINGLGNGEVLSVDINLTLTGTLSVSSTAHATFLVKSGKTLTINGSVSIPDNNVTFYVEPGASLIINGSFNAAGKNDVFGGSGTIKATTINIGKNAQCYGGECPTIISTTCYSGGDNFCSNNVNNCSTAVGAAGSITGSGSVCAGRTGVVFEVASIANASTYDWSLPVGATIASGDYTNKITVDFASNASSGNVTVRGVASCGSTGTSSSISVAVSTTNAWTGAVNTEWNNANNWCGGIPSSTQNVVISSDSPNMPVISSVASCKDLTINTGASLTVGNGNLNVAGASTITGAIFFNSSVAAATFDNDLIMDGTWTESAVNSINFKGNVNFKKTFKGKSGIHHLTGIGKTITVKEKIDVPLLNLNEYTLTVDGLVTATTKFEGTSNTNLVIGENAIFEAGLNFVTGKQTVRDLTINKTGDITLGTPLTVKRNLTFSSSGKIITSGAAVLTLDVDATYANASGNSFIEGPVTKIHASTTPFIFPIGADTVYRRIGFVTKTSTTSAFTAQYFKESAHNVAPEASEGLYLSDFEYFDLHRISGDSAKVILYWAASTNVNENGDFQDLRIGHFNTGAGEWETFEVDVDGSSTVNSGIMTTKKYLGNFSPMSAKSEVPVLPQPVQLNSFNITTGSAGILLEWETSSETNNKGFEIQRSTDGFQTFEIVGFVDGNGTTNHSAYYEFTDVNPSASGAYYRLKQVDYNGKFKFSVIKYVAGTDLYKVATSLYPNPTNGNVVLILEESEIAYHLNYQIISSDGVSKVLKREIKNDQINERLSQDISTLNDGVYTIILKNGNQTHQLKLIKI